MLRNAYRKLLDLAGGPRAEPAMAAVSFAEASFFPLPPDIMLGPMAAARPERWVRFALICTLASVVGGLFGYAIGVFLMDTVGRWLIDAFHLQDKIEPTIEQFRTYGPWAIVIKGVLPIPFKLLTITAGIVKVALLPFIAASVVSRGMRFFLVAWIFSKWGPAMAPVIEKRIGLVAVGIVVLIVAGFAAVSLLH